MCVNDASSASASLSGEVVCSDPGVFPTANRWPRRTSSAAISLGRIVRSTHPVSTACRGMTPELMIERAPDLGTAKAFNHYAVGWAHAMDTPYQWTTSPLRVPPKCEATCLVH